MAKIAAIVSNPCITDARVIKIAEAASEMGHEVHIFATQGQNASIYEEKDKIIYHRLEWNLSKQMRKMFLIKIFMFIHKRLGGFILRKIAPFYKYKMFKKVFLDSIVELNPDLVHAHDLITLPLGYTVAEKCNAKIIYDAHELEVYRNPPLPFLQKRFVSYIEKKYGQKADDVIMVCEAAGKVLEKHLKRSDIHIIFNSPIIEPSSHNIRDDLKISDDVPLVIYVGKVTQGRGVEDTIKLLPSLHNFHFATIGPCDKRMRENFIKLAKKLKVDDRFTILPPVHFKHVVNYIKGSDFGTIVISTETLSYRLTMPNKLQEMTFADVPIIAKEGLTEVERYFNKLNNGILVDFDKEESLSYIFTKFYENRNQYKLKPDKRKFLYEKYSWDSQKKKLNRIYDNLLKNRE